MFLVLGLAVLGGSVFFKQGQRIRPTTALSGILTGLVVVAIGAIGFTELAPETYYTAESIAFPRAWYLPVALLLGFSMMVASVIIGRFRWPTRPRYSFLGLELGLWVAYPALISSGGEYTHPLGYAIALSVPFTVAYILWKDCLGTLSLVLRNQTARWFGGGVALIVALFFMFTAGFLSFFPEQGTGIPETTTITVIPTLFPLVTWPTLEWWLPSIPFTGMLSVGVFLVVGLIAGLVGLNAAVLARIWTIEETTSLNQGAAGTATFVGSNACSCCGPLIGKFVILAMGPSAAAPVYWLFVDLKSPAGALFLTASIALLLASLLKSTDQFYDRSVCKFDESGSSVTTQAD